MPVARRLLAPLLVLSAPALLAPAAHAAGLGATKRVLRAEMRASGSASGAYVLDLTTGRQLYAKRPDKRRIPASVNKLFTTSTALIRFGDRGRLHTEVLAERAPDDRGVVHGDLYLRGDGDPTFGVSQARRFARALAAGGLTKVTGRVRGDESAWDGLRGGPSSSFRTDYWVGPLSALSFNHGLTSGGHTASFQDDPARSAAQGFTSALRREGVRVRHAARPGTTPDYAEPLLRWASPRMRTIVARTNTPSDNYMAEELIKAIGAHFGLEGSTGAGATVVRATVRPLGAHPRIVDGSGLSRHDLTSPRDVVRLISAMDGSEHAAAFEDSLPVMGHTGTLRNRGHSSAASGRCHAKTGTLHDVSALAGYCDSTHGDRLAFAFLMNRTTSTYWAHVRQDRMAAALATFG